MTPLCWAGLAAAFVVGIFAGQALREGRDDHREGLRLYDPDDGPDAAA